MVASRPRPVPGHYSGQVFGGQLLAQAVLGAAATVTGRTFIRCRRTFVGREHRASRTRSRDRSATGDRSVTGGSPSWKRASHCSWRRLVPTDSPGTDLEAPPPPLPAPSSFRPSRCGPQRCPPGGPGSTGHLPSRSACPNPRPSSLAPRQATEARTGCASRGRRRRHA